MLPMFSGHPVITNPVTVRANAALAGAGAWDATPTEIANAGHDVMTLFFEYTRGGAAGAFDWQIQGSPTALDLAGVEDWFPQSLIMSGVVAAGADAQNLVQRDYTTYTATGATVETFMVGPFKVGTLERIRVRARESGNTQAPGTLMIRANFGREGSS